MTTLIEHKPDGNADGVTFHADVHDACRLKPDMTDDPKARRQKGEF